LLTDTNQGVIRPQQLVFLRAAFRQKGYRGLQIHNVLNTASSIAFLHYVRPILNRISRVLARHNIGRLPNMNIASILWPVKDNLGFRPPGVIHHPL
jgi:hypothetical protein